jgi:hypothetical protein
MAASLVRIQHDDLLPLLNDLPVDSGAAFFDKRTIDAVLSRFKPLKSQHAERAESLRALDSAVDALIAHAKTTEPALLLQAFEARYAELKAKSAGDSDEIDWLLKQMQELYESAPHQIATPPESTPSSPAPEKRSRPPAPTGRRARQRQSAPDTEAV